MRVRGLKHDYFKKIVCIQHVAPHAGAWIETDIRLKSNIQNIVAPHAGAWIETDPTIRKKGLLACRTPCGCVD